MIGLKHNQILCADIASRIPNPKEGPRFTVYEGSIGSLLA